MSFVACLSGFGIGLLASDTRFSRPAPPHDDSGSKLRRVPGGWVAATGAGPLPLIGLRYLEEVGVHNVPAAAAGLASAERELHRRYPALEAERERRDWGAIFSILQERDGRESMVWDIGRDMEVQCHEPPALTVSTPGGLSELKGTLGDRFSNLLQETGETLPEVLKAVAQLFVEVHELGGANGSVSAEMEVGLFLSREVRRQEEARGLESGGSAYIRAPAAWIRSASAWRLMRALQWLPPAPPPFPTPQERELMESLASWGS